ncbi:MAG: hypothetical protein M1833_004661 [Piccolia ochrophora]|nr:MAG: hypothetical protein M1833_004661 [Piccolia ochrophora]
MERLVEAFEHDQFFNNMSFIPRQTSFSEVWAHPDETRPVQVIEGTLEPDDDDIASWLSQGPPLLEGQKEPAGGIRMLFSTASLPEEEAAGSEACFSKASIRNIEAAFDLPPSFFTTISGGLPMFKRYFVEEGDTIKRISYLFQCNSRAFPKFTFGVTHYVDSNLTCGLLHILNNSLTFSAATYIQGMIRDVADRGIFHPLAIALPTMQFSMFTMTVLDANTRNEYDMLAAQVTRLYDSVLNVGPQSEQDRASTTLDLTSIDFDSFTQTLNTIGGKGITFEVTHRATTDQLDTLTEFIAQIEASVPPARKTQARRDSRHCLNLIANLRDTARALLYNSQDFRRRIKIQYEVLHNLITQRNVKLQMQASGAIPHLPQSIRSAPPHEPTPPSVVDHSADHRPESDIPDPSSLNLGDTRVEAQGVGYPPP